jgi:ABC-2 type transport system permease protein
LSPSIYWAESRFFQELVVIIYALAVDALWFAPLNAWLLLASAWARRAPFLWTVLPLFMASMIEMMLFKPPYFAFTLRNYMRGAMQVAFTPDDGFIDRLSHLDPVRFLSTPYLWVGLAFAAACLRAAVHLRRRHEPI